MTRLKLYSVFAYVLAVLPSFIGQSEVCAAQATGTLVPKVTATDRAAPDADLPRGSRNVASKDDVTAVYGEYITPFQQANFATLLNALGSDSRLHTSGWTATITSSVGEKEAKVQANLCDIAFLNCAKAKTAASISFISPLEKNATYTELADLNGLRGTSRVEAAVTLWATSTVRATARKDMRPTINISASFARPNYNFSTSSGLAKDSVKHPIYSAGLGVAHKRITYLISLDGKIEDSYKEASESSICVPVSVGVTDATRCSSYKIGTPSHVKKKILSLEGRKVFSKAAAASILLSRDFQKSVWGVDMPVWFVQEAAGGLGSGVRFGYKTDSHKWTMSVFVATFKL